MLANRRDVNDTESKVFTNSHHERNATMDLIAQVELARDAVKAAEPYGFPAVAFMILFVTIVGGLSIHFVKIVIPDREARERQSERLTSCHEQNTKNMAMLLAMVGSLKCRTGEEAHETPQQPQRPQFGV